MTPTSWDARADMSLSDWNAAGHRLGAIGRGVGWWIGDWLRYGNSRFGERYTRAKRITGYDVQTLMNMVYVASRFDADRRYENLSFSHHAELAPLCPEEQDRWLAEAESKGLSVRCLREELRRERRAAGGTGAPAVPAEVPTEVPGESLVCPKCGVRLQASREAA